mgnify:FL=1
MRASVKTYTKKLRYHCMRKYGEEFCDDNEELIATAARNKRLLERFDEELENQNLTSIATGSQGQMKEDINPIIKHRNDVAKLYSDNLEALMLTPRAKYKKMENASVNKNIDPMALFFNKMQK